MIMAYGDELLITYGLGYAFEKSRILIVSEIEERIVSQKEMDIAKEINLINKIKEKLYTKCDLKLSDKYIPNVEEALEEQLSKVIPIITSIRFKNMEKQSEFMEEYVKSDLNQVRLRKEGYIQKDSALIKDYLDNFSSDLDMNEKDKNKIIPKHNKLILKTILTTSFGKEFCQFLNEKGQAITINDNKLTREKFQQEIKNNILVKKKYEDLDFLNLLLFLGEWQKKYFNWDGNYTSLMLSIYKDGKKYNGPKSELKDFVLSFIRENRYLYFPFGKYDENNKFVTLEDQMYANSTEPNGAQSKVSLEKDGEKLYRIITSELEKIDLDYNKQLGYVLLYENDYVYISLVVYDEVKQEVSYVNKFECFKTKMLKVLEEHFIV